MVFVYDMVMKKIITLSLSLLVTTCQRGYPNALAVGSAAPRSAATLELDVPTVDNRTGWEACFVPGDNCTRLIVRSVGEARQEVLVQAYELTSVVIANALIEAHRRGVLVRVLVDKSQRHQRKSQARWLLGEGVEVLVDYRPGIAHNKVMVIDQTTVITGSFNFTDSAQNRNAENLLVEHDGALASRYRVYWLNRREQAENFE